MAKKPIFDTDAFAQSTHKDKHKHKETMFDQTPPAQANNRTALKSNYPYCSRKYAMTGVTDLATVNPELAAEWHPTKNGELTPDKVTQGSGRKVWWLGACGHEWEARIDLRANGTNCPFCFGKKVLTGFNDLATINPELAAQWHPTKNGELTPDKITQGSGRKVWWLGPCGHEWEAMISNRTNMRSGCPYCAKNNVKALMGYNDLVTTVPELAAQWHPTKNDGLTPDAVTPGSGKRVWWLGPCGHEWEAKVVSRTSNKSGCPYCAKNIRRPLPGVNDLATRKPTLAAQWHPTKNGELAPDQVSFGCAKKVWWKCAEGHEWEARIDKRTSGQGCPYCSNKKVLLGFNDLATICPDIAEEWHPTKNGELTPDKVTQGSGRKVWWLGPCGHEWEAMISNRTNMRSGCPYCAKNNVKALMGYNDLVTTVPELAAQWHPTKNGNLTPSQVTKNSHKKIWWLGACGHEWEARIYHRTNGTKCPICRKKAEEGNRTAINQYG